MTPDLAFLSIAEEYKGPDKVTIGNGTGLSIKHIGKSTIQTTGHNFALNNILHVPSIQQQLLSVNKFAKNNHCSFEFDSNRFVVKDRRTKGILMQGQQRLAFINCQVMLYVQLPRPEFFMQYGLRSQIGMPTLVILNNPRLPFLLTNFNYHVVQIM